MAFIYEACSSANYAGLHIYSAWSCRFASLVFVVLVLAWWTQSEQSSKQRGRTAVPWQSAGVWESSGNCCWGKLGQ